MTAEDVNLSELPELRALHDKFFSGCFISRNNDSALWRELKEKESSYRAVFGVLGFDIQIDERGFCYADREGDVRTMGKWSRRFAALLFCLFRYQADQGESLLLFEEWAITEHLLAALIDRDRDVLLSSGVSSVDDLASTLAWYRNKGFVRERDGNYFLLPPVHVYLDYFIGVHGMRDANDTAPLQEDT